MKLAKDTTPGGYAVTVSCVKCGRRFTLADGWADTEGVAFQDYYCQECSEQYPDAPRFINGEAVR